MQVLVIAGVSWDQIIHLDQLPLQQQEAVFSKKSYYALGGTGAGKALNLCRLGFDTRFQCRVAQDDAGQQILSHLKQQPLELLVDQDPQGTETHTNLMDDQGRRMSIYTQYAEFEPKVDIDSVIQQAQTADFLLVNIINYARFYLPQLKQLGKPIWVDLHDYDGQNDYHQDFIDAADVLFFSAEGMADHRTFMQQQINLGKSLVICTRGKHGAIALDEGGTWYEQGIDTRFDRIDTNGAGDSFMSGFLYGYSQQWPVSRCLQVATIVAGLCVSAEQLYHPDLSESKVLSLLDTLA